jgi:hypothetical protein
LFIHCLEAMEHVTVGSGGHGKAGKCFSRFVGEIGDVVGIMVSCRLGGVCIFTQVGMGLGKVSFKLRPSFVGCRLTTPFMATGVDEHARIIDEVVGSQHNLFCCVLLSSCSGKGLGILNMLNEELKWVCRVVGLSVPLVSSGHTWHSKGDSKDGGW